MITQKYHEILHRPTLLNNYGDLDKILFFDIETTGLSPKSSFAYLISAGYFDNEEFHLTQYFAESMKEEILILETFDEIMSRFTILAQFNGNHFDIPYLKSRYEYHNIISHINSMETLDIYLHTKQFKNLFNVVNCKLKTFEKLLNIDRKDLINGGEAIDEYYNYVSTGNQDSLNACLLHNYEDVLNLPKLSELIIFEQLKDVRNFECYTSIDNDCFILSIKTGCILNLNIKYTFDDLEFHFCLDTAKLKFKITDNSIKLHFCDYKKYVFLNSENYAIESSYAKSLNLKNTTKCNVHNAYQILNMSTMSSNSNHDITYLWNQSYGWLLETLKVKKL